jgi:hypothetical protein
LAPQLRATWQPVMTRCHFSGELLGGVTEGHSADPQ